VTGCPGAQLTNVNCFGEIHLEQRALAISQRDNVLRLLFRVGSIARSQLSRGITRSLHHRIVAGGQSRRANLRWRLIAVGSRVALHDLNAAAVAMHIAKAADVHQNVEAELLTGAVGARNLVMTPAMAQT